MPSLALACRLSAVSAAIQSLFKRAKSIARRYNEPLLAIEDDLSNVYQDSAGTLPATVGSPIGRINDLTGLGNNATQATAGNRPIISQVPKRLGPELVVNGRFDTANGWVVGSWVVSGGVATAASRPYNQVIYLANNPTQAGRSYLVTYTVTALSAGSVCAFFGGTRGIKRSTAGTYTETIVMGASISFAGVATDDFTSTTASIDNISVREVLEGTNAASFNGTTNSLQLATNPIGSNLSQPYTIIVAGVVGALGVNMRAIGDVARYFGVLSDGRFESGNRSAGSVASLTKAAAGMAFVAEVTWGGSTMNLYVNGELEKSGAVAIPSVAAGVMTVGQLGDTLQFWNGQITGISVFDRVLTDSERTTIGKAFARELGVTYG